MTRTTFLLSVKAWMLTYSQHIRTASTLSAHTHSDWRTFHTTIPPPMFHFKSKHHLWSLLSLFFHSDPQMKELILCFLPLSLARSHSLSHISFPAIPLTHTRTDGCNSFHFFTFFQSVRNKLLQPRLYFHSPPRHQV